MILRQEDGVSLRYQGRQCSLGKEDARHYLATIEFREEAFEVKRLPDEIVISTVGQSILLSYPQSELWLERDVIAALVRSFNSDATPPDDVKTTGLPQWLSISSGNGRLLLSDGRTGRWVLLSADHVAELERRLNTWQQPGRTVNKRVPPTLPLKGLNIHLQSAFKLAETLEHFADTGNVTAFEETTPTYSLTVERATEGIELRESDARVALTAREARKWASIIRVELDRLNARQIERGKIRTLFADVAEGRWVLQWGDEVLVPHPTDRIVEPGIATVNSTGDVAARDTSEFRLMLNSDTGACVALNELEWGYCGRESVDRSQ